MESPAFDWAWPETPVSGSQPDPGDHLLCLVHVGWRPHYGGRIVWTFEYETPGPRLTIFTTPSREPGSNSTGLLTALNGGEYPSGIDPRSMIGRFVRAITVPKPSDGGHLTFARVRPADPDHPYRFVWLNKPQKRTEETR